MILTFSRRITKLKGLARVKEFTSIRESESACARGSTVYLNNCRLNSLQMSLNCLFFLAALGSDLSGSTTLKCLKNYKANVGFSCVFFVFFLIIWNYSFCFLIYFLQNSSV